MTQVKCYELKSAPLGLDGISGELDGMSEEPPFPPPPQDDRIMLNVSARILVVMSVTGHLNQTILSLLDGA